MKIAIIPARGGSRRIPRKNVRDFGGKPMIAWAIDAARESALFDHIVVSTEDAEIAAVARHAGAEIPFMRPVPLADDRSSTDDVLLHAIEECRRSYGDFDRGCCIYPAVPFLAPDALRRGLNLLDKHAATSAFPVVPYDFPIEQAFVLRGPHPRARWPEALEQRSQDLTEHYHDAGMFYWFDTARLEAGRKLFSDDAVVFAVPADESQDINTPEDWERAELKLAVMRMRRG